MALLAFGLCSACGPGGQTVTGKVLLQDGGSAAGLTVAILSGGILKTLVTSSDGSFSTTGIFPPYDAMVADPAALSVNVFQGLYVNHPSLPSPRQVSFAATVHAATVSGSLTPGPSTTPGGFEVLQILLETPDNAPFFLPAGLSFVSAPSASFESRLTWAGPATLTGNLYLLSSYQTLPSPLPPPGVAATTVWNGFAVLPGVTLTERETLTGLPVDLQTVSSTTVSGTVVSAAGFETSGLSVLLYAKPESGRAFALQSVNKVFNSTTDFAFDAPVIPGMALQLLAGGNTDAGTQFSITQTLASLDAGITVRVPRAATLQAPPEHAVLSRASAAFRWSAVAGATIYVLNVVSTGGGPRLTLYTNRTSATLPDLSGFGPLSPLAASWSVSSYSWPVAVDQLVGETGVGILTEGDQVETTSVFADVVFN